MIKKVDLNSDLGESFGDYTIGTDDKIIPLVSSVNVACGFHAGDPMVMMKTIDMVKESGTKIGAHPGYPDLMGFGRRNMTITPEEAKNYTLYQIGALAAMCQVRGLKLQHVKLHGAFYNTAGMDHDLSMAVCQGIAELDKGIIVLGLSGSKTTQAARDCGLKAAEEVFADRRYEEDGSLVNRKKPGAFIHDENEAVERVIRMVKEGYVKAVTGKDIPIRADSICVHGDGPEALLFVNKIRSGLIKEGIEICPLNKL